MDHGVGRVYSFSMSRDWSTFTLSRKRDAWGTRFQWSFPADRWGRAQEWHQTCSQTMGDQVFLQFLYLLVQGREEANRISMDKVQKAEIREAGTRGETWQ